MSTEKYQINEILKRSLLLENGHDARRPYTLFVPNAKMLSPMLDWLATYDSRLTSYDIFSEDITRLNGFGMAEIRQNKDLRDAYDRVQPILDIALIDLPQRKSKTKQPGPEMIEPAQEATLFGISLPGDLGAEKNTLSLLKKQGLREMNFARAEKGDWQTICRERLMQQGNQVAIPR